MSASATSEPVGAIEIPIDSEIVERAITERFVELRPVRAEPFAQGWDFCLFRVGDDLLFRFPKRRACVEGLMHELTILPVIGPSLGVAVPDYRWSAPGSEAFAAPFAGYRMLHGTIAAQMDPERVDRDAVLDQVAHVLQALHSTPLSVAREAGIGHDADDDWSAFPTDGIDDLRSDIDRIADELGATTVGAAKDFAERMTGVRLPRASEVLIHDDLTAVHMLVDPATGRLSGIIDWADLHLGHPIADVTGWYGWLGRAFAECLLERLGVGDPSSWLDWMRNRVFLIGVHELDHARRTRDANARAMGRQMLSRALEP